MNIECRIPKEGILSIFINKKDGAQPPARKGCTAYASESDSTLRNSAVRYSIFCGSLFNQCQRSGQPDNQKNRAILG